MHTGIQAEVLLCPNCKEEVPKTLYCLNCGYPLYKIDVDQREEDMEVISDTHEPDQASVIEAETIEDVVVMVEELAAQSADEEKELDVEVTNTSEANIPVEITKFVAEVEPEVTSDFEVLTDAINDEPMIEVVEPAAEEVLEITLEESIESVEASASELVEGPEIEVVEPAAEEVLVDDVFDGLDPSYEPDPGIREVMENFGKNISMKIKLLGLLKDGGVKLDIFKRLFDSYDARGKLLMNSRSEMLERVRYDLSSMEKALNDAKARLEELEIRRSISDVSEQEYAVKSPGYEWDINKYEDDVKRKKAEIKYLENIKIVLSKEEILELIETGEECYGIENDFVKSEEMNSEMANKVKSSLDEALTCLRTSI